MEQTAHGTARWMVDVGCLGPSSSNLRSEYHREGWKKNMHFYVDSSGQTISVGRRNIMFISVIIITRYLSRPGVYRRGLAGRLFLLLFDISLA